MIPSTSSIRIQTRGHQSHEARRLRWGWVIALALLGAVLPSSQAQAAGGCTITGPGGIEIDRCDDNNPCTNDLCHEDENGGSCSHAPNPIGTCDNSLYCDGTEQCSAGVCVHSGNPCPGADGDGNCSESCNEASNSCNAKDPTGSACNDGVYCNGADTCDSAGQCGSHAGDPCPGADGDGNCAETCKESNDSCTGPDPAGAACADGLYCNGTDTCDGSGQCAQHTGDPCPVGDGDADCSEECNEASDACTANDPAGSACGDDVFCNGGDSCDGSGHCTQHAGDPCAGVNDGTCANQCNEATEDCDLPDPAGTACADDGNACTTDACSGPSNTAYVGFTASTASPLDATYEILSWQVAGTAINFNDFGSRLGLELLGAAYNDDGTLRLTQDGNNDQVGATWWDQKIPVAAGLDVTFTFRITGAGSPADGFAFVIQNSPQGTSAIATDPAGSLGYEGIPNSVAIEFDTFQDPGELIAPHISVRSQGTLPNSPDTGGLGSSTWSTMANGQVHTVRIEYTPGSLKIYADGDTNPYVTSSFNLAQLNLGPTTCDHAAGNAGVVCRESGGECDVADVCTGSDESCLDVKVAGGTECSPDGSLCTLDVCDGDSAECQHPAGNGGTLCRESAGECDVAESCNGSDPECPADATVDAGTACTDDGSICSLDVCDGVNPTCQHPAGNAGVPCRGAVGVCDVAETCTGSSATCPSDGFATTATTCRASAGVCDPAETCTGSSASCPTNQLATSETECRASAGVCDVAETCTGSSASCPANQLATSGTECRAAAGECDLAETCSGASAACPADAVRAAGTSCRDATDICDVAETCDGVGTACPSDLLADAATECRASAGACDPAEQCTGSDAACPADALLDASTTCRASQTSCDPAESCTGSTAECPADVHYQPGEVCRSATDACDVAEVCDAADECPADDVQPDGTACDAGGACTASGTCEAGVCTPGPDACSDDASLCYKAKPSTSFVRVTSVPLSDGFESGLFDLLKPRDLCPPAAFDGQETQDPAAYAVRYLMKASKGQPKHVAQHGVRVTNQVSPSLQLDTIKADSLLVPAAVDPGAAPTPPSGGNQFKCYKAKVTRGTPALPKGLQVTVADAFGAGLSVYDVKKVSHLCRAAVSSGEADADANLVCYQAKLHKGQAKPPVRTLSTSDAFGSMVLQTSGQEILCVPSTIER